MFPAGSPAPLGSKLLASIFHPKHRPTMGHTLRQGTSCLIISWLLVLAGVLCLASGRQVTKSMREAVMLSCEYNISVNELDRARVYWQKDKQVVLSIVSGKTEVWREYKNRTILDIPNKLSLVILTLRLSDRGTYTCVVQKSEKGTYKLQHLFSIMLYIKADFPTPSITDLGNMSTDIKRILCLTSGGFPKPHLSWLENGEEINTAHTMISQDHQTELFTVRSSLDFNTTSNHVFKCLVKYGDSAVSETFIWQKPQPPNPDTPGDQFPVWMPVLIFISVAIAIAITITLWFLPCNRFAPRWRNRSNKTREQKRTIYHGPETCQAEENV